MERKKAFCVFVISVVACLIISFSGFVQAESRLDTVIKRGHLIVGTRANHAPHGFVNEKNELVGFDIDVGRAIAKLTFGDSNKVEFVRVTSSGRVLSLVNGSVDYVQSTLSITSKRAQVIGFTMPYLNSTAVFIVRKDSNYKKNSDLNGAKVAFSQSREMMEKMLKVVPGMKIVSYESHADAASAFAMGRTDAVIKSIPSGKWFIKKHPKSDQFRTIIDDENPLDQNQEGIGVVRGEQEWLNYLNTCLGLMKRDNIYRDICIKWYGGLEVAPKFFKDPI